MAVKPITNPNPVPLENLNRANQKSFKNSSDRTMLGNRERSVQPTGTNYSKDYEVVHKTIPPTILSIFCKENKNLISQYTLKT